jgi:hypothetical protein
MDSNEFLRIPMDSYGFLWIPMDWMFVLHNIHIPAVTAEGLQLG